MTMRSMSKVLKDAWRTWIQIHAQKKEYINAGLQVILKVVSQQKVGNRTIGRGGRKRLT